FAKERLAKCMEDTSHCTGLVLCLALSYSSRWEIVEACKSIAQKAVDGDIAIDEINADTVSAALTTRDMPDPDLLIRTAGDERISNFLLWQIAYSELFFTDKFWPDFTKDDFCDAIVNYQQRERRFGKTSEQVTSK
ncbi:MAG: di-trans,poly-cis-decaprenylcistransferase, partial [Muribaculaceae bacterium]|nr:di-trans,poly-cis-decaprenylcistransferase [Muribaculaceae bacterium]